jgi:hypothetical protein
MWNISFISFCWVQNMATLGKNAGPNRRIYLAYVLRPGPPRMIWFVVVDTRGFLLAINLHHQSITLVPLTFQA